MEKITAIVNSINTFLDPKYDICDFELKVIDHQTLLIIGSFDFSYYHNIEIYFTNVSFFKGGHKWSRNENLPVLSIEGPNNIPSKSTSPIKFVFHSDECSQDLQIKATRITFNTDTVLYYKPDVLQEGQRLAEWLL